MEKYQLSPNELFIIRIFNITKFDYIFGDFVGDKVRLKGFYESNNKNVKKFNDIKFLEEYKKDYCNYGAKTFLLKKVSKK